MQYTIDLERGFREQVFEFSRDLLVAYIQDSVNLTEATKRAGLGTRSIYRMLNQYGIEYQKPKHEPTPRRERDRLAKIRRKVKVIREALGARVPLSAPTDQDVANELYRQNIRLGARGIQEITAMLLNGIETESNEQNNC
jgi:transposase